MYRKSRDASEPRQERQDILERPVPTLKLTDQYLGLLVAILTNAGLCEVCIDLSKSSLWIYDLWSQALTAMLEESTIGTNLSRKATLLMAEVLAMANRVLPLSLAAKIQVWITVIGVIASYDGISTRPFLMSSVWQRITSTERTESLELRHYQPLIALTVTKQDWNPRVL